MMYEILRYLRNFFPGFSWFVNEFTIENGQFVFDELREGQYFMVEGSHYNDGLHIYGESDFIDETFNGWITEVRIPKELIEIEKEIKAWIEKYADSAQSPFISESFGGYAYSKSASSSGGSMRFGWQDAFFSRLKVYKKL